MRCCYHPPEDAHDRRHHRGPAEALAYGLIAAAKEAQRGVELDPEDPWGQVVKEGRSDVQPLP